MKRLIILLIAVSLSVCTNAKPRGASSKEKFLGKTKDRIFIKIGKPRHWTLEDAHFLIGDLQKKAREDLSISAPTTLDPNAFNSSRLDQIVSVLKVAAEFDESAKVKNEFELEEREFEEGRRDSALQDIETNSDRLSELRGKKLSIELDKIRAEGQRDSTESLRTIASEEETRIQQRLDALKEKDEGNQASIQSLEAELEVARQEQIKQQQVIVERQASITAAETSIAQIQSEIERLESEITADKSALTLSAPSFSEVKPDPADGIESEQMAVRDKVTQDIVTAITENTDFKAGLIPSQNVSDQIQNYLSASEELLARQLTVLKREIGDDETLIFLELPHSIDTDEKASKGYRAQVEWKIKEVCIAKPDSITDRQSTLFKFYYQEDRVDRYYGDSNVVFEDLEEQFDSWVDYISQQTTEEKIKQACSRTVRAESNSVSRDLLPSYNAYNIADYKIRDREGAFSLVLSWLTGFGLNASYQRRRQTFEQFASQDVFASAYGEGSERFGWVLSPKPGSSVITPGAKTTYATLSVPTNTTAIRFETNSCVIPKGVVALDHPEHETDEFCDSSPSTMTVLIGDTGEFFITELNYGVVRKSEVATIVVKGFGFSSFQNRVLVNGVPLKKVQGRAAQARKTLETAGEVDKPMGIFEVSKNEIAINLKMPPSFVGTPEITITSPNKTITINYLPLRLGVIGGRVGSLFELTGLPMFQDELDISDADTLEPGSSYVVLNGGGINYWTEFEAFDPTTGMPVEIVDVNVLSSKKVVVRTLLPLEDVVVVASNHLASGVDSDSIKIKSSVQPLSITSTRFLAIGYDPSTKARVVDMIMTANQLDEVIPGVSSAELSIVQARRLSQNEIYIQFSTARADGLVKLRDGAHRIAVHRVRVPMRPSINRLEEESGAEKGGDSVKIKGQGLANVDRVMIGKAAAEILSTSEDAILIRTPAGKGKQPVYLYSDLELAGKELNNRKDFLRSNPPVFEYKSS